MSRVTWIGTCRHPGDGKDYIISYNDCCGKSFCGRCQCNRNEGEKPVYVTPKNNVDMTLMLATTGRRLFALGVLPLPDIYEQAHTTLDAAANWRTRWHSRVKLAAKNLLDQEVRQLQGGRLASSYHTRRSFSIEFSWGY